MYFVYILECNDGTLYTGISNNLEKRVMEHNQGKKGAKYTRSRRPVKLVYFVEFMDRSSALKEEARIKKLRRREKLEIISYENRK